MLDNIAGAAGAFGILMTLITAWSAGFTNHYYTEPALGRPGEDPQAFWDRRKRERAAEMRQPSYILRLVVLAACGNLHIGVCLAPLLGAFNPWAILISFLLTLSLAWDYYDREAK